MMVGVVAASAAGASALIFYLAAYTLMNLGAFAVITIRERETPYGDDIRSVEGLARERPGLAAALTVAMLALAGLPGHRGLHRQALPDRGHGRRRLHLARGDDRDRDDDLARLLPAGDRRGLDAARRRGPRSAIPVMAGGSQEADAVVTGGRCKVILGLLMVVTAATIFFGVIPSPLVDWATAAGDSIGALVSSPIKRRPGPSSSARSGLSRSRQGHRPPSTRRPRCDVADPGRAVQRFHPMLQGSQPTPHAS